MVSSPVGSLIRVVCSKARSNKELVDGNEAEISLGERIKDVTPHSKAVY